MSRGREHAAKAGANASRLDHLVREYVAYYHHERPHQGKGNLTLIYDGREPPGEGKVLCRQRLGGVLRHYLPRSGGVKMPNREQMYWRAARRTR
ncbi:MAG TPA: hypothetical protein VGR35_19825 [Tepidisphaeraceae bacterium]|nr:hypothetical protein [Tepidisphaeraceae bacterium]